MLYDNTACSHLFPLAGLGFSAAACCQAHARLPLRFFDLLLARFGSAVPPCLASEGWWPGHRTCLVDGAGCAMPDTPVLQGAFGSRWSSDLGAAFPWRDCWGC